MLLVRSWARAWPRKNLNSCLWRLMLILEVLLIGKNSWTFSCLRMRLCNKWSKSISNTWGLIEKTLHLWRRIYVMRTWSHVWLRLNLTRTAIRSLDRKSKRWNRCLWKRSDESWDMQLRVEMEQLKFGMRWVYKLSKQFKLWILKRKRWELMEAFGSIRSFTWPNQKSLLRLVLIERSSFTISRQLSLASLSRVLQSSTECLFAWTITIQKKRKSST